MQKNSSISKLRRKWVILISSLIGLVSFLYLSNFIFYSNSSCACAQITKETAQAKGGYSTRYIFTVDEKTIEGKVSNSYLKRNISLDSLKKIKCIKIEYSNYSTYFNRVIDKRILK